MPVLKLHYIYNILPEFLPCTILASCSVTSIKCAHLLIFILVCRDQSPDIWICCLRIKLLSYQKRYAKMHLWGLTQYNRIIYLDADTMVVGDIHELFSRTLPRGPIPNGGARNVYTGVLAAHDRFAGIFNSGVMVLEPSKEVIRHMLEVYMDIQSYNLGDQGFLNVFWKDATTLLEGKYNYLTWLALSTWGKSILSERRVMHYTAEVKPWNFLDWQTSSEEFFGHLYIANLWQEWIQVADNVQQTTVKGNPRFPVGEREAVCSDPKTIKHYTERKYKGKDASLTVVLKVISGKEDLLSRAITTYLQFKDVLEVIVVLPSKMDRHLAANAKNTVLKLNKGDKKVTMHKSDNFGTSLFFPHLISTAYVMVADHTIELAERNLKQMFTAAKTVPGQAVGPFVYTVDVENIKVGQVSPSDNSIFFGMGSSSTRPTVLDTSLAIIRTDYLFLYTCIVDTRLLNVVEMVADCEGLLMNIVASSVSEHPVLPLSIDFTSQDVTDRQTQRHARTLARCTSKFKEILGSDTLNLRRSRAMLFLE